MLLWALLSSTTAIAREPRQGTVLVAGRPGEPPAVLYVAAGIATLVRFEGLVEPRVHLTAEERERLHVAPLGERSLAVAPVKDLEEGERVALTVTGRTESGGPLKLPLVLVTRRDEVDAEAWVRLSPVSARPAEATEEGEVGAVAGMLLASHVPEGRPRLALAIPQRTPSDEQATALQARVDSVLRVDRHLFVTVAIGSRELTREPWRLVRVRLEVGCAGARVGAARALPVRMTHRAVGEQWRFHTFATRLPEGVECLEVTLEEDGPRTLRFGVEVPR
jgi:hypothetical protein